VPVRLVLARTEEVTIAVVDLVAYSTGFALRLTLRLRPEAASDLDPRQHLYGVGDERLRFGVEFADGRRATNTDQQNWGSDEAPLISLVTHRGGGGTRDWENGYWVYPLPPPGPVTLALAWPVRGIAEQTQTIDAAPIVEAAGESIELWEDTRPLPAPDPEPAA
jgi:hypothetical protein